MSDQPLFTGDLEALEGTLGSDIVQTLIGCAWGRAVRAPDDPLPCPNKAVKIVVVHLADEQRELKLCARHRDRVYAETTPHKEDDEPDR